MEGQPHWRGIYNDHHELMVAINFNSDMGDSWEHADDPFYPVPMTRAWIQAWHELHHLRDDALTVALNS